MRRLALATAAVLALSGCEYVTASGEGGGASRLPAPVTSADKAALLAKLGPAKPEDTGAHYNRKEWGDWAYDPATKCNTRESVLVRDGEGETVDEQCRSTCPTTACWTSHYDGVKAKDPADLQIDHLVPVAEANRSGARGWTAEPRAAYYNDPSNLLAVSGKSNQSKSDGDPGKWRPTAREHWCAYATGYVAVKVKYQLTVDDNELAGLTQMLNTCPAA